MGCSGLLILGLVLNVAHCLETLGQSDMIIESKESITAVLGDDTYLSCRYLGGSQIQKAAWKRQVNSIFKSRALAGISGKGPFGNAVLSEPESLTNLTVKMNVSGVELEGEYICEFESEEEDSFASRTFVTILVRPIIQVLVDAETINGTHYQSVSCSAIGGRPPPQIRWLIDGLPVTHHLFTVNASTAAHSNGTSTLSSVLRFPTHLQDDDRVTCEVQHPTLPSPALTTVRVETYARPNVSIEAAMVQRGGTEFWVVSCLSSGGRPDADISLALNTDDELRRENNTDSDAQRSSVYLPATRYEGHNVTCAFVHPKFTHPETRVKTLPSFYLTGARLMDSGIKNGDLQGSDWLKLQEGQRDVVIGLQVTGNVPRYNVTCKKDDGLLPDGVELVDGRLAVQGPVEHRQAGPYECTFSYHHHRATLHFNITVNPRPARLVEPAIEAYWWRDGGRRVIECSAADAVPAANMSWLLPEGVSGDSWFNFTSHNGSQSVRGVFLLPACLPWELTAVCVINHAAFEKPENRSITLPMCARPNVTVNSSTDWKDGERFTTVQCSAHSVAPAAALTWRVGGGDDIISGLTETDVRDESLVCVRSSVRFSSAAYAGRNVTCVVQHPSLEQPENRSIHIPVHKAPELSVSVMRQQHSRLWLAVCECTAEDVRAHLAWVVPENVKGQTTLQSEFEGHATKARLTYQFPLESHEGQDLTCVYQLEHGATEERSVRIPKYRITAVRVLNHTTPLRSRSGAALIQRLSLEENQRNQKILLQVDGNVPQYELSCKRADGSFVHMEGLKMAFQAAITERDEGLYTCTASFYHHTAQVQFHVEVMCEEKLLALVSVIGTSSAAAVAILAIVALWVCCKIHRRTTFKNQESLSTFLMQEPGSPEGKRPGETQADSKEYAHLVSYSIVIDQKSTV
ncbi:uncharacterized protein si:ch211-149e23.4 isoform X2 [Betta splendens]|uniref:Uncharacterized protein si:ch211-149e23.4 isoform X2 n=1 Tax=Betta splendens TaxID=158456 RepID=A0A6P7PAQ4_BETSP|nr:uncharacterized protein si:ch211-149e23.4 isoform X2 [Betta splendens]